MDSTYTYAKERRRFGRECLFAEQNKVIESIPPDPQAAQQFIRRNPVADGTQLAKQFAASEANTVNAEYRSHGAHHSEGGWPKDVNMLDEEQTLRHRKKIERDDQYAIQLNRLLAPMLHAVQQNNAVQLYENYFDAADPVPAVEQPSAKTVQCFRNPSRADQPAAAAIYLSFSPDGGTEMAVAYARTGYQAVQLPDPSSYVWRLDNPQRPLQKLHCPAAACLAVEYNARDGRLLAGGLIDGKVCVWDSRTGGAPTHLTRTECSHRTRCTAVQWLHAKSNALFYSGSADGQLLTWDMRKMLAPVESLVCDPMRGDRQSLAAAYGVSVLEYEYTMPNKYLVGTEEGAVFFGNRKGSTPAERLYARMQCNSGPVRALERNPMFGRYFATVGEYRVKVFSEECRDNPVLWMCNRRCELTCGTWSRTRGSLLIAGRADGVLDCWDLLVSRREPVVALRVAAGARLERCRAHETGKWVACGDANGEVFLVELSEGLRGTGKAEKALLAAMLERETRREKIMEAKMKELKLRDKQAAEARAEETGGDGREEPVEGGGRAAQEEPGDERARVKAEFLEVVLAEQKRRDAMNKY